MGQYLFSDLVKLHEMMRQGINENRSNKLMNPQLLKEKIKELQYVVCNDNRSITIAEAHYGELSEL